MTKKQLDMMGFRVDRMGMIFHAPTETQFRVNGLKKATPKEVINKFHEVAFEQGVKWGETKKVEEIKKALSITNNDNYSLS